MESLALKYLHINLDPTTIGIIDSAYLCLLYLYGQGPRTVKSLMMTALVYGLPAILKLLNYKDEAGYIQQIPKYASRIGMAYSFISLSAIILLAVVSIPLLSALFRSPSVQDLLQSATITAPIDKRKQAHVEEVIDDGEDADGEEDEDEDDEEDVSNPQGQNQRVYRVQGRKRNLRE